MGAARRSGRREQSLQKKAAELAILCGVDVCVVGRSPEGGLFFWPDGIPQLRRIGQRYLDEVESGPPAKRKREAAAAAAAGISLSDSSSPTFKKKKQKKNPSSCGNSTVHTVGNEGDVCGGSTLILPVEYSRPPSSSNADDFLGFQRSTSTPPPSQLINDSEQPPTAAGVACGSFWATPSDVSICPISSSEYGGDNFGQDLYRLEPLWMAYAGSEALSTVGGVVVPSHYHGVAPDEIILPQMTTDMGYVAESNYVAASCPPPSPEGMDPPEDVAGPMAVLPWAQADHALGVDIGSSEDPLVVYRSELLQLLESSSCCCNSGLIDG